VVRLSQLGFSFSTFHARPSWNTAPCFSREVFYEKLYFQPVKSDAVKPVSAKQLHPSSFTTRNGKFANWFL